MNISATLAILAEAWWIKMEPWRNSKPVVAGFHHFEEELDPDLLIHIDANRWILIRKIRIKVIRDRNLAKMTVFLVGR